MTFNDHFQERINQIASQSGHKPPSELLMVISCLERECLGADLNTHDTQKYQQQLEEIRQSLRKTEKRKFRFKLSDKEPETTQDNATQTPTARTSNQILQSGSHFERLENCYLQLDNPGSVHVSDAIDCVIIAKCHQLRLTDCSNCQVFVSCPRPVIEGCQGLKIGHVAGEPRWQAVDDFNWLRPGTNPHWTEADKYALQQAFEGRTQLSTRAENMVKYVE